MKMHSIVIGILLLAVGHAEAEQQLSIKEAISLALEKNNLVRAATFKASAARQGIDIVTSRYYPGIFFEETAAASNAPTQAFMMKLDEGRLATSDFAPNSLNHPATTHDFKTALTIQQPLYQPALAPLREIALKDAEKSELELEAARQDVAFLVFRLYLEAQKSAAQLQAAQQAVADAHENMRLAIVRTDAGVGLKSDELRARTHRSTVEQQLISADNNLILAKMQLASAIGLPDDQHFDLPDSLERIAMPMLDSNAVADALENRVEMKQSQTLIAQSDAALRLAKSDRLPTVAAFASYQLNGKDAPFSADNDAWSAGVTLKWQLFDGFRRYHERDRAVANRSAAMEMRESKSRDVRFQLKESYLRRNETGKRLEVARHAVLDAEETVRLLTKRFENSLAIMVELLDAQTALNQSRANLVETGADYALAGGRVYYMSGTFVKEMLK